MSIQLGPLNAAGFVSDSVSDDDVDDDAECTCTECLIEQVKRFSLEINELNQKLSEANMRILELEESKKPRLSRNAKRRIIKKLQMQQEIPSAPPPAYCQ